MRHYTPLCIDITIDIILRCSLRSRLNNQFVDISLWMGATFPKNANLKLTPICYAKPPQVINSEKTET